MLTDYTDLESEIGDAEEPKVLPTGTEIKARIVSVSSGISESEKFNGCTWHQVWYDVPDEPMTISFSDFFWRLDKALLDASSYAKSLYQFQTFAAAFGIDYSRPFDWEDDLPGKDGWMIVGIGKDDPTYGRKNTVKKYVAPRSDPTDSDDTPF